MSNIFDSILDGLGVDTTPESPEKAFYIQLTEEGKYKRIENCIYWLKHELCLYEDLKNKSWSIVRPSGNTHSRVPQLEVARAMLEYYFLMYFLPKFENERGTVLSMSAFLDLV